MIKLMALVVRKPGMSRDAFIDYYENRHVPLIREVLPFMTAYRRNYPLPGGHYENPFADATAPAVPYDAITEVWYPDRAAFERMQSKAARPEVGDRIAADEENFVDRAKTVMFVAEERICEM